MSDVFDSSDAIPPQDERFSDSPVQVSPLADSPISSGSEVELDTDTMITNDNDNDHDAGNEEESLSQVVPEQIEVESDHKREQTEEQTQQDKQDEEDNEYAAVEEKSEVVVTPSPAPVVSPVTSTPASVPASSTPAPDPAVVENLETKAHIKAEDGLKDTATTGVFCNLVDGDGNYNCTEAELNALMHKVTPSKGAYAVVGIMGCQSSGKSTLLNLLFGTQFREMNAQIGRQQTTKGVWMDAGNVPNVAVLDLEGTDSGERGEDRTTFERQTSLYALALAEVLILNMWEHDIGRYTASNYGILQTCFEVNLSIFQGGQGKTILLFVIRDHVRETSPFEALKAKLIDGVHHVWSKVRKPEQFQNAPVSDFFEFEFCSLPHKVLQPQSFTEGVMELKSRFADPSSSRYLFNTPFHGKKSVPSDGFAKYAHNVWETIRTNKDVNLPSQREMLATFRCDEISNTIFGQFASEFKELKEQTKAAYQDNLASRLSAMVDKALASYDIAAERYEESVVRKKRAELRHLLVESLNEVLAAQFTHINKRITDVFSTSLKSALPSGDRVSDNFYTLAEAATQVAENKFKALTEESVPSDFEYDSNAHHTDAMHHVQSVLNNERQLQINKLTALAQKRGKSEVAKVCVPLMKDAPEDMWQLLAEANQQVRDSIFAELQTKLQAFKATETELENSAAMVKKMVYGLIREAAVAHVDMIGLHMRHRFDMIFRHQPDGLPRQWTSKVKIEPLFIQARDEALALLDLFSTFQLSSASIPVSPTSPSTPTGETNETVNVEDVEVMMKEEEVKDSKDILITEDVRRERERVFRMEIEGALREARNEQDRINQATKVPVWMLVALVFLGWNEFMSILRNPIYFMLLLLLGGAAYVIHSLNMWGPIKFIAQNVIGEILRQTNLTHLAPELAQQQAQSAPSAPSTPYLSSATATDSPPSLSRASSMVSQTSEPRGPVLRRAVTSFPSSSASSSSSSMDSSLTSKKED